MANDPLKGVQDLAQRVNDDAEEFAKEALDAAHRFAHEGVGLTHDSVQVVLDTITLAREKLAQAQGAILGALKPKP